MGKPFRGAADLVERAVPPAGAWRFEPFTERRKAAGQAAVLEAEPAGTDASAEAFTVSWPGAPAGDASRARPRGATR